MRLTKMKLYLKAKEEIRLAEHTKKCDEIALEFNLNKKQSRLLHSKAYEDCHSSDYEEVEQEFYELCSLFVDCLNAK